MVDRDGAGDPTSDAMEDAIARALAACDGDPHATIRALLIALDATEQQIEVLRDEVAQIRATVSDGYVRGRLRRPDKA